MSGPAPTEGRQIVAASRLMEIALDQLNAETKRRLTEIVEATAQAEGRDETWQFDVASRCWFRNGKPHVTPQDAGA